MMIEGLEIPDGVLNEKGQAVFATIAKRIAAQPGDEYGLLLIAYSCQRQDDASLAQQKLCDEFFLTHRKRRP